MLSPPSTTALLPPRAAHASVAVLPREREPTPGAASLRPPLAYPRPWRSGRAAFRISPRVVERPRAEVAHAPVLAPRTERVATRVGGAAVAASVGAALEVEQGAVANLARATAQDGAEAQWEGRRAAGQHGAAGCASATEVETAAAVVATRHATAASLPP